MNLGKAHCPVCRGQSQFKAFARDRFYKVTPYLAPLHSCQKCACVFQWPMPEREQVATFYPTGYWQESQSKSLLAKLQATYIDLMMRWDLMRYFKHLRLPSNSFVIDVGCSRGDWLAKIKALDHQVLGIEADPRAASAARKLGVPIQQETAETWQPELGNADAVLAFHLVEHLVAPKPFLKSCYKALKPGGKLLIRVPNIGSLQYRLLGDRWKGLEMPRHLVMYRPKPLKHMLQEAGFQIKKSKTWSLRDGPPCFASSLFPSGEPTWRAIHKVYKGNWRVLAYLLLTGMCLPVERLAAVFGYGSMITIIAEKPE